jgi:hypothetical protein
MKSVLLGCIAAALVAYGAFYVLDTNLQQTADQRNITSGARL